MRFLFAHVRPLRLPSGGWTLYEYRYYDEFVPIARLNIRRQRRRVWPPIKQPNGRGRVWPTRCDAWYAYTHGGHWRK